MPTDAAPDYAQYLGQINAWPSERHGEPIAVAQMAPGHAINALHKLILWAQPAWSEMEIRRTPLAMALLSHAVGQSVIYSEDLPEASLFQVKMDRSERPEATRIVIDLETCFDALTVLADNTTIDTHPVTRTRILFNALANPRLKEPCTQ